MSAGWNDVTALMSRRAVRTAVVDETEVPDIGQSAQFGSSSGASLIPVDDLRRYLEVLGNRDDCAPDESWQCKDRASSLDPAYACTSPWQDDSIPDVCVWKSNGAVERSGTSATR